MAVCNTKDPLLVRPPAKEQQLPIDQMQLVGKVGDNRWSFPGTVSPPRASVVLGVVVVGCVCNFARVGQEIRTIQEGEKSLGYAVINFGGQ